MSDQRPEDDAAMAIYVVVEGASPPPGGITAKGMKWTPPTSAIQATCAVKAMDRRESI
jgi:hypothetical protein